MEGNVAKTMSAPVVALTAYDVKFFEHAPYLMPHFDVRPWFEGNEAFAAKSAFQNGTLQVAYLILALRSVGLDTGPMTGFDTEKADAEFFPDGRFKSNVLINIGFGDHTKLFPRSPRFNFDQIAKII
jgi:3-hydroxypropanoate dehydrogenase